MNHDRALGALLGTAVGDALGMPIDGLSHQNVRTYYRGIKGYRADEHRRDLGEGQWTGHTQRTFALAKALPDASPEAIGAVVGAAHADARRAKHPASTVDAAAAAAPLGVWWAAGEHAREDLFEATATAFGDLGREAAARAAAFGQAAAVQLLLSADASTLDGAAFFADVIDATAWAEDRLGGASPSPAARLRSLADHLDDFPLDLQDLCDGTDAAADEAWPFAVAIVARNPLLLESTVLPAINVGGAASAIGACVGALVGALHGWAAFPDAWREGLEDVERLEAEAGAFASALG
jgi:ADP-ribosylglycohydrolase